MRKKEVPESVMVHVEYQPGTCFAYFDIEELPACAKVGTRTKFRTKGRIIETDPETKKPILDVIGRKKVTEVDIQLVGTVMNNAMGLCFSVGDVPEWSLMHGEDVEITNVVPGWEG
jgi:hypothetical protein